MQKNGSKKSSNIAVCGIDAGGTKSEGVLASTDGRILFRNRLGCGNYQAAGINAAEETLSILLKSLEDKASESGHEILASGYGISGYDRKKDMDIIEEMICRIDPLRLKFIANDTFLILRAGTPDGVGVAVVSGTGPNTVGRNALHEEYRVGGLSSELGDFGGGMDIAREAIKCARRGKDGRGNSTILEHMIVKKFSLNEIEDVMDWFIGLSSENIDISEITRLVFEAAKKGDAVARNILIKAGKELGLCARLTAGKLFSTDQHVTLVLGGSVLQKGEDSLMRDTLIQDFRKEYQDAEAVLLSCPPVAGAVLHAVDILAEKGLLPGKWPDHEIQEKICDELK
jgi:N-acetylglucosamine kinase-like BadF-type ATPase